AAQLNPNLVHAETLAITVGPEQIRAALVHGDDLVIRDRRHHPFTFTPNTRTIRPVIVTVTFVEKLAPRGATSLSECLHIVGHFQEPPARWTRVDGLRYGPTARATTKTSKFCAELWGSSHGADYITNPKAGQLFVALTSGALTPASQ